MHILKKHPIFILLAVNLIIGLLTFQSYGLSWDEPLFYDYAKALQAAYNPEAWFSGSFDLQQAFGASGSDHANRGPAYIVLAQPVVSLLLSIDLDEASAWHLTNFLVFQIGVYLFYQFTLRWVSPSTALFTSSLFSWQPLLWGHSFINPKDIPFLVFFLGAVHFGFELVDELVLNKKVQWTTIITAAFFVGISTSIRVLGPLASILTLCYALTRIQKIPHIELAKSIAAYTGLSLLVVFATWPYLWMNPLQNFIEVFGFMSDNPTQLNVLFNRQYYQADELPHRYLPILMIYTLTEPIWGLFLSGLGIALWKSDTKKRVTLLIILAWLIIPAGYVMLRTPPMYDGYRHFLFMLPPVFFFSGFAFEYLILWIKNIPARFLSAALILGFGIIPLFQLHPYQYAYYNLFAGGVGGVFRNYETEYWLTCYKEAVETFNQTAPPNAVLVVKREPYIAEYYTRPDITVLDYRTDMKKTQTGDFILINSRSNEDIKVMKDAPIYLKVGRDGADFCVIKQIP